MLEDNTNMLNDQVEIKQFSEGTMDLNDSYFDQAMDQNKFAGAKLALGALAFSASPAMADTSGLLLSTPINSINQVS